MAIRSRFSFVGDLHISNDKEKFVKKWKGGKSGKLPLISIDFAVRDGKTNKGFVRAMGTKMDTIFTMDKNFKKLEVPYEERFDEDVLANVSGSRKHFVNLGEDFGGRQEFISTYDMIEYLEENLPNYNGKVMVNGEWKKNPYKERFADRFEIGSVYAVEDDRKSKLQLTMDFIYNADSIDATDFKSQSKIYVNGYVEQYIDKDTGSRYIPQTAILSCEQYDMKNEDHKKIWDYKKKYLTGLPKKKYHHIQWESRLINGAQEVEFDESVLTDSQKEQISLGIRKASDFAPAGGVYGERVYEIRLFDPVLKGEFVDGIVELDDTMSEFEEKIYTFAQPEKLEYKDKKKKADDDDVKDILKENVVVEDEELDWFNQ
ncbi:hypothetical protein M2140_000049 [Clostridiales Family XIII bacterium PM5-7]